MEIFLILVIVLIVFFVFKGMGDKKIKKEQNVKVFEQYKPLIERLEQIVKESLKIAESSKKFSTVKSRTELANEKVKEIEAMMDKYPIIEVENFSNFSYDVQRETNKIMIQFYDKLASINAEGQELEKDGKINEAIQIYKKAVEMETDTPFTYKRLAILYRKEKDIKREKSILKLAIKNSLKKEWFKERLDKLTGE